MPPAAPVAFCRWLRLHSQSCMAVAREQAPVSGRSLAMMRIWRIHSRNWVRKSSSVMVTLSWRGCTASGPSWAALQGLGTFVGGFELRIHPLVAEEPGAVLGDAVAAHQADGFAHHAGAVARIPHLTGGAEHVGPAVR